MKPQFLLLILLLLSATCCKEMKDNIGDFFASDAKSALVSNESEGELLEVISMNRMTSESMMNSLGSNPLLHQKARLVRRYAEQTLDEIGHFREELISQAGIYYENGKPVNLSHYREQMAYTIGEAQDGAAYVLQKQLRAFVKKVNAIDAKLFDFEHFALDGWELDADAPDKLKEKDFAHLHFERASNLSCLNTLRCFQKQVTAIEVVAITKLFKENEKAIYLTGNKKDARSLDTIPKVGSQQ